MQALERELALLHALLPLKNPNDAFGKELQNEISKLHPKLAELELRIRRSVVFAPSTGSEVINAAQDCMALVDQLVSSLGGNFDSVFKNE